MVLRAQRLRQLQSVIDEPPKRYAELAHLLSCVIANQVAATADLNVCLHCTHEEVRVFRSPAWGETQWARD